MALLFWYLFAFLSNCFVNFSIVYCSILVLNQQERFDPNQKQCGMAQFSFIFFHRFIYFFPSFSFQFFHIIILIFLIVFFYRFLHFSLSFLFLFFNSFLYFFPSISFLFSQRFLYFSPSFSVLFSYHFAHCSPAFSCSIACTVIIFIVSLQFVFFTAQL